MYRERRFWRACFGNGRHTQRRETCDPTTAAASSGSTRRAYDGSPRSHAKAYGGPAPVAWGRPPLRNLLLRITNLISSQLDAATSCRPAGSGNRRQRRRTPPSWTEHVPSLLP